MDKKLGSLLKFVMCHTDFYYWVIELQKSMLDFLNNTSLDLYEFFLEVEELDDSLAFSC